MHTLRLVAFGCPLLAAAACHNQSTDNDRGQAAHGKAPDSIAVAPQPVVAAGTGPASSVPAANLARTVPPGPPNHDGPAVCHVAVGNLALQGRTLATENTGNVGIRDCKAVVYAYDRRHVQVARVALSLPSADGGGPALEPRDAVRTTLPLAPEVAQDPNAWFVPVVTHVDFVDGTSWDAPEGRAPAQRPFTESTRGGAIN